MMTPARTRRAAPAGAEGGVFAELVPLFCDAVGALARGALGRLNRLAALAAEDGYERADGMFFPSRDFRDFHQRDSLRPLHHRDDLGLLVAAFALVAGLLARRCFPRGLRLLCLLGAFRRFRRFRLLGLA